MAIIMNGSPLFTGDAGFGPSEIRRWILENDLPRSHRRPAGAAVLQHRHRDLRLGHHQPEGTRAQGQSPARSTPPRSGRRCARASVTSAVRYQRTKHARSCDLLDAFEEGEHCRIYPTTHFGYRKITVERPLKLNFQASPERIARLDSENAFKNLASLEEEGRRKAKAAEEAEGRKQQGRRSGSCSPTCRTRSSSTGTSSWTRSRQPRRRPASSSMLRCARPSCRRWLSGTRTPTCASTPEGNVEAGSRTP